MASKLREKTQKAVDEMRASVSGCNLVLLIDPDTGLVLSKSSDDTVSQDRLNSVATAAQTALRSTLMNSADEVSSKTTLVSVSQIGRTGTTVTLQPMPARDEALVCRFDGTPNRDELSTAAKSVFAVTSGTEAA